MDESFSTLMVDKEERKVSPMAWTRCISYELNARCLGHVPEKYITEIQASLHVIA